MSSYGCLVVFASDDNVNDIVNSIKDDITIIPIYLGKTLPSKKH